MHFRHVDDEILFGRLKAQLVESLRGAPTHMLANVLRVLGRIESVAFYEGVRQGVVAKAIEQEANATLILPSAVDDRPIALHARVYNGSFTPLAPAEERYIRDCVGDDAEALIEALQLRDGDLRATPLEMPPMTLAEALAAPTGSFAAAEPDPALLTTIFAKEAADAAAHEAEFPLMDEPSSPWLANGDHAVIEFSALRTDGAKMAAEQPSFIERCRDALQTRMGAGWGPAGWADVVFAVRDDLKVDPFAIDLSLSTDVGKSMLRSIGLFEIADTLLGAADIDAMLGAGAR